jgi:DNA-binding NarL/FixJ family response regulator
MRVVLAGMTNLLLQIVAGVVTQWPESQVVGSVDRIEDAATKVRSSGADVLMMPASERPDREAIWPLLRQFPQLKVVTIATNGDGGAVYELQPVAQALPELSAAALGAALRRAGGGALN